MAVLSVLPHTDQPAASEDGDSTEHRDGGASQPAQVTTDPTKWPGCFMLYSMEESVRAVPKSLFHFWSTAAGKPKLNWGQPQPKWTKWPSLCKMSRIRCRDGYEMEGEKNTLVTDKIIIPFGINRLSIYLCFLSKYSISHTVLTRENFRKYNLIITAGSNDPLVIKVWCWSKKNNAVKQFNILFWLITA